MRGKKSGAVAISDLATEILDPVLRKRAGMSVALVQCWDEIAGERLAQRSRPEKIVWSRRGEADDPFEPATLVIACEGVAALHIQHETTEIIGRVNAFLGYGAIGRIRIVQKPVSPDHKPERMAPRALSPAEKSRLSGLTGGIDDDGLRAALRRLGSSVLGSGRQ